MKKKETDEGISVRQRDIRAVFPVLTALAET